MQAAARFLTVLAFAVAVAGLVSLYLTYPPDDAVAALGLTWVYTRETIFEPWVLGAATVALGAALGARALESYQWRRAARREGYPLDAEPPAMARATPAASGAATTPEPAASARPAAPPDFRARLGRHLGRRPDLLSWLDDLLMGAIQAGASDVHVQPQPEDSHVAFRVDGELRPVARLPRELHPQLLRRLKVMAHMPPYRTDTPQDGRLTLETPRGNLDVRLSVVPTRHGEKAALRFSQLSTSLYQLGDLGLPEGQLAVYRRLLEQPQGLIVLTGPTGSGKTTTIYASLQHLHRERGSSTHISTIEEPVELDLPFLDQTEVNRARGLDFAKGLRALLRQDPDVLMVGEIRDRETAQTAIQAGLSGHLILTTLHTDSAAGVFNRLIDMDVEPFLVASATLACLSQRLARRLCRDCRRQVSPDPREAERLARHGIDAESSPLFRAAGCATCHGSGFSGRLAIFELLEVTRELRQKVTAREPTHRLQEAAVEEGMVPLVTSAVRLAEDGSISIDELLRVIG